MMDTNLLSNVAWYLASHLFPMDINLLCDNPDRMCPLWDSDGSWGNAITYAKDDCMRPLLGITTLMGGGGSCLRFVYGACMV